MVLHSPSARSFVSWVKIINEAVCKHIKDNSSVHVTKSTQAHEVRALVLPAEKQQCQLQVTEILGFPFYSSPATQPFLYYEIILRSEIRDFYKNKISFHYPLALEVLLPPTDTQILTLMCLIKKSIAYYFFLSTLNYLCTEELKPPI